MTHDISKVAALAEFLGIDVNEAQKLIDDGDYNVYSDEEADDAAKDYILDSAWAFNHSFLCIHSEAIANIPEKEWKDMAGRLCEGINKAVLAMLDDKEHFVADAVRCDGRGHFLSSYDGYEHEQNGFYIYRTN